MKRFFTLVFVLLVAATVANAQSVRICSWNLRDFGKSKGDSILNFIADVLRDYDVVALQEVVAGDGGAKTVAALNDALNRRGAKWDYVVSDPTYSSSYKSERYAFLWKSSKLKLSGRPWLEQRYKSVIDREPYYATFTFNAKQFTLVNFHAITKSRQPETEVKYFKFLPDLYPKLNLLFCGDFNLPQSHSVFNPLKSMGYLPALVGQRTSLKMKMRKPKNNKPVSVEDRSLASEFDNFFYKGKLLQTLKAGVDNFYKRFNYLEAARRVSDHLPIFIEMRIL
ncbi:MAG: endonuclease/exonuclease/phosphatase family protein [Flavitalea sp.]